MSEKEELSLAGDDDENPKVAAHLDILSQALPVARLADIDLNTPPVSGEDYLTRVRLEALENPIVVAKKVDLGKYEKNRTPQFQPESIKKTATNLSMPIEWQNEKCAEFSQLRDRTRKERQRFLDANAIDKSLNLPQRKSEWYKFCFGKNKSSEEAHEPNLSILYRLNQKTVTNLFDYLIEWVLENGYSRLSFEWLYSLMCFLEKPLVPETHSSLRSLCRYCISARSEIAESSKQETKDEEKLIELNLFISLIGRYFQQYDLIEENQ